jgi:hypothetical protein
LEASTGGELEDWRTALIWDDGIACGTMHVLDTETLTLIESIMELCGVGTVRLLARRPFSPSGETSQDKIAYIQLIYIVYTAMLIYS